MRYEGRIPRRQLGMILSVISNPFDRLRVDSMRDLSQVPFSNELES